MAKARPRPATEEKWFRDIAGPLARVLCYVKQPASLVQYVSVRENLLFPYEALLIESKTSSTCDSLIQRVPSA